MREWWRNLDNEQRGALGFLVGSGYGMIVAASVGLRADSVSSIRILAASLFVVQAAGFLFGAVKLARARRRG